MSSSTHRTDLKWGYLAQALNVGAGLLLLPAVVRYLAPEDVGLWFVFLTMTGLAQLLELGFQPTVTRNTAYVFAGARSLTSTGLPASFDDQQQPDPSVLAKLIAACRMIYRGVALAAAVLLLTGGGAYIITLLTPQQQATETLLAWALYAIGNIVNFYFGYVNALLQGRGSMSDSNKVIVSARLVMLLLGVTALVYGAGLLGLGAAMLASSVVGRWLAWRLLVSDPITKAALDQIPHVTAMTTVRTLWHNASRLGIAQIGAFLIQRANVLIVSSFLGVGVAASFGMTVTLLMTLSAMAAVILQVRMPRLVVAQASRDIDALRSLYGEVLILAWGAFIAGLAVLVVGGDWMLQLVGSKTRLLPTPLLCLFGIVLLLELNHSLAASYLTTRNHVPFVNAGLFSGILIVAFSILFIKRFEVTALIAAQGLVQLAYNNWKWPREARRDLGIDWRGLVAFGVNKVLGRTPDSQNRTVP